MAEYSSQEPVIVSRLWDVLRTLRSFVTTSINNAGITDSIMVLVGYPTYNEASRVWSQPVDPGFVTIDALPDIRNVTRYRPEWGIVGPVTVGFSATNTNTSATFSSIGAQPFATTNVHFVFYAGGKVYDAQYTTNPSDTPNTVASAVAAAVVALAVPGVGATASGNVVTVSGTYIVKVNAGGTGSAHKEVGRVERTAQISIWVNMPWSRFAIHEAITSTLGATDNQWLQLPDYGWFRIRAKNERMVEESQLSYNIYEAHLLYDIEYGIVQRATAAQIGAIDVDLVVQAETAGISLTDQFIVS